MIMAQVTWIWIGSMDMFPCGGGLHESYRTKKVINLPTHLFVHLQARSSRAWQSLCSQVLLEDSLSLEGSE